MNGFLNKKFEFEFSTPRNSYKILNGLIAYFRKLSSGSN